MVLEQREVTGVTSHITRREDSWLLSAGGRGLASKVHIDYPLPCLPRPGSYITLMFKSKIHNFIFSFSSCLCAMYVAGDVPRRLALMDGLAPIRSSDFHKAKG